MLVLGRLAKHHERMAYIAELETEDIELGRALLESENDSTEKPEHPDGSLSAKLTRRFF